MERGALGIGPGVISEHLPTLCFLGTKRKLIYGSGRLSLAWYMGFWHSEWRSVIGNIPLELIL